MPEDSATPTDHVEVVLRGPDGKIKDTRGVDSALRERLVRFLYALRIAFQGHR